MKRLIVIGAGGHGRVVADIAKAIGYEDIAFLDDTASTSDNIRVLGPTDCIKDYVESSVFIVAIGNSFARKVLVDKLKSVNAKIVSLVHPSAIIGSRVKVGEGTVIMAGVVVNADAKIGEHAILNTGCTVDHDCIVDDYSHISVGAHLCGTVEVGKFTWIGAGSTVINNITICDECFIGAGAVVVKNIDEKGTYIGVPARLHK